MSNNLYSNSTLDDTGQSVGEALEGALTQGPSVRIGEMVFRKSGTVNAADGYLAVSPGVVTGGATLYPLWAAMYPEFVSGLDIVFPTNVEGIFLRNLGGNAGVEGVFQSDSQARSPNNPIGTQVNGGGGNTVRSVSVSSETRPDNRAYQLYTIVDTYTSEVFRVETTSSSGGIGGPTGGIPADFSVETFADLPSANDKVGELYYVRATTGTFNPFVTTRPSGWYRSDGTEWIDDGITTVAIQNLIDSIETGLRGAPVADIATLTALPAKDFELRRVLSDGMDYVFSLGATSGDFADIAGTGFWSVEIASTGSGDVDCQTLLTNLVGGTDNTLTFTEVSTTICSVEVRDSFGERIEICHRVINPNQVVLTSNVTINDISVTVIGE